jgi:pyridoxamine 5'-phosphate oxidase
LLQSEINVSKELTLQAKGKHTEIVWIKLVREMHDPVTRFQEWLGRAERMDRSLLPEPTAFALGTVSAEGRPSVRMLLLKGVVDGNFVFYTNLESRKGRELLETPIAAMCFHWAPLELQVRIEGMIGRVSEAEADRYFASRPRESQLAAWASDQSRPITVDGELERRYADVATRFHGRDVPRPEYWSGFSLQPARMEFWQGKPFRLHVRELYLRHDTNWKIERLFP